jgi:pimeloyl-ACP methyl ester carboxylesterase
MRFARTSSATIACSRRPWPATADEVLPWPQAARRYRHEWLPHADWIELDEVGHYPQHEVPLVAAELILGLTRPGPA